MVSSNDEIYLRPWKQKIFVSSKMRGGALRLERKAAAEAIESTNFHTAWFWERDAPAGPYSSEAVCLGHARTSDGLVLLLADDLTLITHKEYKAAYRAGTPCYIFLKEGYVRTPQAQRFLDRERARTITSNFKNPSELCTHITHALYENSTRAVRKENLRNRALRSSSLGRMSKLTATLRARLGKLGRLVP